jgi:cytochrome c oxidase subunit 2
MAREIDWLHQVLMWIILVIFVGVFGFMFYACFAHRKSRGHRAAQFHENTTVEILWTVIPALILIVIAWPVTKTVIAQKDTSAPDLTIKVTGYQWKWGYDYLKGEGEGISFVSTLATPREQIEGKAPKGEHYLLEVDHEVVVPVGKKVRVLTTAADVVHAWWVPAFGAKQDAIPGFIRDLWFRADQEGTFRSQCVELCGKEHASCRSWCAWFRRPSTASGWRARRSRWPPRPTIRTSSGTRRSWSRAGRRSTPRPASPATGPPARAPRR